MPGNVFKSVPVIKAQFVILDKIYRLNIALVVMRGLVDHICHNLSPLMSALSWSAIVFYFFLYFVEAALELSAVDLSIPEGPKDGHTGRD